MNYKIILEILIKDIIFNFYLFYLWEYKIFGALNNFFWSLFYADYN